LNPAFFGKVVPLAGQRKPPSTSRITRLVWPTYERLSDGRYLIEHWMENRCCNRVQVGSSMVCVVDDYGSLVAVEDRGAHGGEKRIYTQAGGSHYKDFARSSPLSSFTPMAWTSSKATSSSTRRGRTKNGAEDLRKVIHYAQLALELQYGEAGRWAAC
jgi:hypothetical protein